MKEISIKNKKKTINSDILLENSKENLLKSLKNLQDNNDKRIITEMFLMVNKIKTFVYNSKMYYWGEKSEELLSELKYFKENF